MIVSFLDLAESELDEAYQYYESKQPGLGIRFAEEVSRAIRRITAHPTAYQKLGKRTRRCLIAKFPYGIIFQPLEDEIVIIGVAHLHKRPKYWLSRSK